MYICDNNETEMKYSKWKTPLKGSVAVLAFPSKEIILSIFHFDMRGNKNLNLDAQRIIIKTDITNSLTNNEIR